MGGDGIGGGILRDPLGSEVPCRSFGPSGTDPRCDEEAASDFSPAASAPLSARGGSDGFVGDGPSPSSTDARCDGGSGAAEALSRVDEGGLVVPSSTAPSCAVTSGAVGSVSDMPARSWLAFTSFTFAHCEQCGHAQETWRTGCNRKTSRRSPPQRNRNRSLVSNVCSCQTPDESWTLRGDELFTLNAPGHI